MSLNHKKIKEESRGENINRTLNNNLTQEKKNEIISRENERKREEFIRKQQEELKKIELKKKEQNVELYENQMLEFAKYESYDAILEVPYSKNMTVATSLENGSKSVCNFDNYEVGNDVS